MLQLNYECVTITSDDVYQALCILLVKRINETAPLSEPARVESGAVEIENEGQDHDTRLLQS